MRYALIYSMVFSLICTTLRFSPLPIILMSSPSKSFNVMLINSEILIPVEANVAIIALSLGLVAQAIILLTSLEVRIGSTLLTIFGALSFFVGFVVTISISFKNSKYLFALPTLRAIVALEFPFAFIQFIHSNKSAKVISSSVLFI